MTDQKCKKTGGYQPQSFPSFFSGGYQPTGNVEIDPQVDLLPPVGGLWKNDNSANQVIRNESSRDDLFQNE
jgi:hypothetical protein